MSSFTDIVQGPTSAAGAPSSAPVASGFSSIVEAPSTQSVAAVKTAQQPAIPQFQSDPSTTDTVPPPQNFFQKSLSTIGNGISSVWNNLVTPKIPSPSLGDQGDGFTNLTPEQQTAATATIANATDQKSAYDMVNEDPDSTGFLGAFKSAFIPTHFIDSQQAPGLTQAQQQVNQQYATDHPVMSAIANAAGQLANLFALGKAGAGFDLSGTVRDAVGPMANLFPTATRIAGMGAESGSIFGIASALNDALTQSDNKQPFSPGEFATKTSEGIGTGVALGGAGALPTTAARAGAGAVTLGGLTAIENYVKNGQLTSKDILPIIVNAIVGAGFEAVGGRNKTDIFNTEDMNNIAKENTVQTIMSNHPETTREQAEATATVLNQLSATVRSGIEYKIPADQFAQVPKQFYDAPAADQADYTQAVANGVIKGQTIPAAMEAANHLIPDTSGKPYHVSISGINNPSDKNMVQVKQEAKDMLQSGHSIEEVSEQLQKELGTPPAVADTIVHQVQAESLNSIRDSGYAGYDSVIDNNGERSVPTNSLTDKAALSSEYQPSRIPSVAQVYKAGDISGKGNYIQGTYQGKPYTTNQHILEFNNDLTDKKGLTQSENPAPTEAAIHGIIPDGGVKLSVDNVKTTGKNEYVNLTNKDLSIHVDRKYYDYLSKKYPEADFVGTTPITPVKIIEDGKVKALLMPTDGKFGGIKPSEIWNKSHQSGLSAPQTPVKIPTELPKVPDLASQERGPITLNANLVPGLDEFIKQDIVPRSKGLLQSTKNVYSEIVHTLDPVGSAPSKAVDILFKEKGDFQKYMFNLEQSMKEIKEMWNKQPEAARMDFMSRIEKGESFDPAFKDIADMYRTRLDNAHKTILQYKDIPFLENFFPHFWKKPDDITSDVMKKMGAKNPLQGTRSFLKQRVFSTIEEGIAAGYKPISTNPEELMQTYEANVRKFAMAQNIKADMIDNKFWSFVKHGDKIPDGFAKIDDAIANVYFPIKTESGSTVVSSMGTYYAQEDVARLINNYLSKNKILDTALGRGLMDVKNTMNAFQLGISAFHIQAEIINSIVSKFGVGIGQLSAGNIAGALKSFATAPLAPIKYFNDGRQFFNGDPTLKLIEDSLFTGGADLREKQYYKNGAYDTMIDKFKSGNYIGAALRAPMGIIEATMRPIFGYMIPRMKIGAFRDLYSAELARNAKKIASGELSQETLARTTWRNIENRFGELNYDNLMWNQTFKGAMMLGIRAPGWNVGTVSEIGGFASSVPRKTWSAMTGNGYDLDPKTQYALALAIVVGAMGAAYQYLHTGKGPSSVKDLYAPKNGATNAQGQAERTVFASYLKDAYSYGTSPIQTVENKASPEFATIIALLNNKNYYGDYIRNPADKTSLQAKQMSLYLAQQFEPFSVAQFVQQKTDAKTTEEQQIESFLGFVNAPKNIVESAYEKNLEEIYSEQRGAYGPRTPEQVQIQDAKTAAAEKIRKGDYSDLITLEQQGIITPRGANTFVRNSFKTSAEKEFQQLNAQRKARATAGN